MPALEGEPARLGVPGGIQERQVGLQGLAEQRRSSSMPAQCLSCLSPGCCTEVGVQQMGSQGKAEARGGKTSRQTNEPKRQPNSPAQSLVQQAWGGPRPRPCPGREASPARGRRRAPSARFCPRPGAGGPARAAAGSTRGSAPGRLSPKQLGPRAVQRDVEAA